MARSCYMQFEIELLSFSEYDEVRGTDGNVLLKLENPGEGYERPKENDIVLCKLKLSLASDDTLIGEVGSEDGRWQKEWPTSHSQ